MPNFDDLKNIRYLIKTTHFFCAVLFLLPDNLKISKAHNFKKNIQTLMFIFFCVSYYPPLPGFTALSPAELDVARPDSAPAAASLGGTGGGTGPVLCKVTAGGGGTMFFKTSAEGA